MDTVSRSTDIRNNDQITPQLSRLACPVNFTLIRGLKTIDNRTTAMTKVFIICEIKKC